MSNRANSAATAVTFSRTAKRLFLGITTASAFLASAASHAETLGFVVTNWDFAGQFTAEGKTECPSGFNHDNRDNFRAQFKTLAEQQEAINKYSSFEMRGRGPTGETDIYSPELIQDTLPYTDAKGTISNGVNLDGTVDGSATPKTCAHTKLTSPDGRKDVDNQLYRVMGCNRQMRPDGIFDQFINNEIITKQTNRWLVEISDVDNRQNDDHVTVTVAHGLDKLVQDASGKFIPGLSQRIDHALPRYIAKTTGKIVNGVLITDPFTQILLPTTTFLEDGEHHFKNAVLRLQLSADNAVGTFGGYHDVDRYYRFIAKTAGHHGVTMAISGPSIWAALKRNADGFKDQSTGQCTAISASYDVKLVRAFIIDRPAVNAALESPRDISVAQAK